MSEETKDFELRFKLRRPFNRHVIVAQSWSPSLFLRARDRGDITRHF
jgi:hypothetical protein